MHTHKDTHTITDADAALRGAVAQRELPLVQSSGMPCCRCHLISHKSELSCSYNCNSSSNNNHGTRETSKHYMLCSAQPAMPRPMPPPAAKASKLAQPRKRSPGPTQWEQPGTDLGIIGLCCPYSSFALLLCCCWSRFERACRRLKSSDKFCISLASLSHTVRPHELKWKQS